MESRPVLFYDGGCALCRREIAHYRRLDRAGRVEWVDLRSAGRRLEGLGIDPGEAMRRIHAVDGAGRVVTGVDAFVVVWERLPGYRLLAALLCRLPLLRRALAPLYGRFARWRLRRRCRSGDCAIGPAERLPRG